MRIMKGLVVWVVFIVCVAGGIYSVEWPTEAQGPLTNALNLRVRTSTGGDLLVNAVAAGAQGPLTNFGNISLRTYGAGDLGVAINGGTITPDTICLNAASQDVCLSRQSANVLQLATGDSFVSQDGLGALGSLTLPWGSLVIQTGIRLLQGANLFTSGRAVMNSPADGIWTMLDSAETNFTRLNLGGTTSSFPALGRSTTALEARLADGSAYTRMNAGSYGVGSVLAISSTAPTISSGFGTTPSITANNGTIAFRLDVGTGGTASSGVIGLPTATTGWNCSVDDVTTPASFITDQTASTTTTATVQNYSRTTGLATAWTASDILAVSCAAF